MIRRGRQLPVPWAGSLLFVLATPADGLCQEPPAPVHAARIIERDVRSGYRVVGTVNPVRRSTIGSAVDGRVIEFLIKQGDAVRNRQTLARLRTGTLKIELASAQAELSLREQELSELTNGSRPEDLAEARARMLGAKAVMQNTAAKLDRSESLFARNVLNRDDLEDARERSEAARQMFLAAEATLQRITAGPRVEQIAQAEARLQLQREQVRLIEDRISKHNVVAPFDGFVAAEHTQVGEWIQQGDPIAEIIELSTVEVLANVPAEQAVRLESESAVRIEFPELPDEVFTGTLHQVVPDADVRTRTFPVNIRLRNRTVNGRPVLLAGMLARLELSVGTRTRMPLVPKDALVLNGTRRFVLVAEMQGQAGDVWTVRSISVTLGIADGTRIQVNGDLCAGQLVVVRGNERLREGQQVSIVHVQDEHAAAGSEYR